MLPSLSLNHAACPHVGDGRDISLPRHARQVVVLGRQPTGPEVLDLLGHVVDVPLRDGVAGLPGELGLAHEERRATRGGLKGR